MDWKKYLPIGIIAIVVLYALSKTRSGATQIINRGIDFTANPSVQVNRDQAQTTAFGQLASVALGQQRIESSERIADKQIEAEKLRLNNALAIEQSRAGSRSYDIAQQIAAQDRLNQRVADQQRRQQQGDLLAGILGALGGLLNRQQRQSGGGSSGGIGSPPFNPNTPTRRYRIPQPNIGLSFFDPGYSPSFPDPDFGGFFGWPSDDPFFEPWNDTPWFTGPNESEYPRISFDNWDYGNYWDDLYAFDPWVYYQELGY